VGSSYHRYTTYADPDQKAHGTVVVDCTGLVSAGPGQGKRRVLYERVPLTELDLVPKTPTTTIGDCRLRVKDSKTTVELLRRSFEVFAERPFLGQETVQGNREFAWTTYGESYDQATAVVRALFSLGVPRGSFVGLCAHNSTAHVQAFLALLLGGFVAVPLSVHLNADHAEHIVKEAKLQAVFVSPETCDRYTAFAQDLPGGCTLHVLNCLEGAPEVLSTWAKGHDNPILSQATVLPASLNDASGLDDSQAMDTFEGLISCPSLAEGDVWMQLQVPGGPKPVKRRWMRGVSDVRAEAWGR
jgi:hypothetical protein